MISDYSERRKGLEMAGMRTPSGRRRAYAIFIIIVGSAVAIADIIWTSLGKSDFLLTALAAILSAFFIAHGIYIRRFTERD